MDTLLEKLSLINYRKLIWVLAISETIHNLEEAIWLPAWSQNAGVWLPPIGAFEFRFADIIVTLIIYAIIYYFSKNDNKTAKYLMGGLLVMILFNVFMPHLIGTIMTHSYAPGVISGLLLNVPVCIYLLWRGLKEGIFRTNILVLGGLGFAVIMAPMLKTLFAIGYYIKYFL